MHRDVPLRRRLCPVGSSRSHSADGLVGIALRQPRRKHRAGRASHHSFSNASNQEMLQSRTPVCAHDDEVATLAPGHSNYLFDRVAFGDKVFNLDSPRCRNRTPKVLSDPLAVTLGLQFSRDLPITDSRRAQAGDGMQDQDGCRILARQVHSNMQGITGVFRIIGWMEDASGLEHEYRHQKGRVLVASTCPAGDVIISQGAAKPAAPLDYGHRTLARDGRP